MEVRTVDDVDDPIRAEVSTFHLKLLGAFAVSNL
jgi:hypothetical protein